MEDKLYLSYFNDLASHDPATKKQAAMKIVETLSVSEALSKHDYSQYDEKIQKMLEKFMKGDLGKEVSPDLNYTLKK